MNIITGLALMVLAANAILGLVLWLEFRRPRLASIVYAVFGLTAAVTSFIDERHFLITLFFAVFAARSIHEWTWRRKAPAQNGNVAV